jgi:DNA-binding CsgD family transcriptional regulator/PAS domain-containing protein
MDEFQPNRVADLVGCIYQAAVEPGRWSDFVAALERTYPDSRVTLFGHRDGCPTASLGAHVNYAANDLRDYAGYFAARSPYLARSEVFPVRRAFRYETIVPERVLRQTEYYNDYLAPRRLGYHGTGFIIERSGPRNGTVLSLADHANDPERRARQLRLLDLIGPHLWRGLRLHRTISVERARAGAAQAAFDKWAHAAVVFDASGRIAAFNAAAEHLFRRADGVWLGRGGQLRVADEARSQALARAVHACASDPGAGIAPIALPRRSGQAPLHAMAWPLGGRAGVIAREAHGAVLLVIFDPTQARRTPIDWLARQYGLSPAEQRLAEAIVNGVPLSDAAEQLGIRLSTARTRLKTIQTKTGCHRQVDLVRLALSLPTMRDG